MADGSFVILAHRTATEYAVERYDKELKRLWSTPLPLTAEESIDGFGQSSQQITVLIYRKDGATQSLAGQAFELATGKIAPQKKLTETAARNRRPGAAFSLDGTKIVAWQYVTRDQQIRSISASVYNEKLTKLKDRVYNFQDLGGFFSTTIHIDNEGTQYVTLLSDDMKKLTVRRYRNDNADIKVMSVALGGSFEGKAVMVFDAKFALRPDTTLYAAAICTERLTGLYYSLKVVKFDFKGEGTMKFVPEFRFKPEYLAEVNKATQSTAKRLEDVYLTDLLFTEEKQMIIVAEKKYEEGGDASPVHARELHLFGYNEFQLPEWHSIIDKKQVASPAEAFAGIGYRVGVFGPEIHILTQEKLKGKSDLYLRRVNAQTGVVQPAKGLGLNVANDQQLAYVKDFTAWLDPKTIVGVSRPSKKSAALQLNKIAVK
ncbi:hypothetical protein GCM10011375_14750 [Hymenobacter qilianensis]|uniref:Uncharacterized protein n=2 Tax=Hymenobacter qilianensis TaxID=1385715 RepID=A0ACB5PQ40_9BACT|nr:hypothetical protein [Hymenobacter qilianensis]QNP53013.1 hypothetical protein H9L05_04830 [Hymenobacter qilianensis]GGF60663.1 hypothetical protein GCM10011375_14750 [Hymenobacter qilianensis]